MGIDSWLDASQRLTGDPTMNFDFSEDQKLLQKTARDFLAEHSPLSVCREVLESDQPYSQALWKAAAEMGYPGTVIPEEYGGAGYG
jgi:alkylation response protein AidB-like acyl-CoA dehydrogenase